MIDCGGNLYRIRDNYLNGKLEKKTIGSENRTYMIDWNYQHELCNEFEVDFDYLIVNRV